jgi:hypothetical protein
MIEAIGLAAVFVALAVAAFVASVRIGILVGRRLDGAIEARAAAAEADEEPLPEVAASENRDPQPDGNNGREENRGE